MSSPTERLELPTGRVPALDGIRGVAILLVMVYHQTVMVPMNRVDARFFRLTEFGFCGVDLFFVLSGFLITGILYDAKGTPHYFRNFFARRALRICPLYYAVLVFCLLILPRAPHAKSARFEQIRGDEFWYWAFLANFSIARAGDWRHGILDVTWSLSIEEQFYLAWPLIVFLGNRRTLLKVCAAAVLLPLVLRCVMIGRQVAPIVIYVLTPTRLDALAMGAWVALAVRGGRGLDGIIGPARYGFGLAGSLLLGFLVLGHTHSLDPWNQTAGYSLLGVFFAATLVLALPAPPASVWHRILCGRVLRFFGKYSYALYLFHLPLRALIRDAVYGPLQFPTFLGSQVPGQLLFYVAATSVTCAAARVSWQCFESPFLNLKRHFAPQPPSKNPPPSP